MICQRCGKETASKYGIHSACMTSADKSARLFASYKINPTGQRGSPEQWRQAAENALKLFDVSDDLVTLEITAVPTIENLQKIRRKLMMKHHPDRGGDSSKAAEINAAVDRILVRRKLMVPKFTEKDMAEMAPVVNRVVEQGEQRKRQDTGLRAQLLNPIEEQEADKYLNSDKYCLQEKKDGKHILLKTQKNENVIIANKQGLETSIMDSLALKVLKLFGENSIVDGELIGDQLWIFDLLMYQNVDYRKSTYAERYEALAKIMLSASAPKNLNLVVAYFTVEAKKAKYAELKSTGKEGAVFKRLDTAFKEGRPTMMGDFLKLKFWSSVSAIVDNESTGKSSFKSFVWKNGKKMSLGNCTVQSKPIPKPGTVVEIKYLYAYSSGKLIQPIYLGERDDVNQEECLEKQLKYKSQES